MPTTVQRQSEAPHTPERVLGPFSAWCVVVGAIVGVGIFFTPSNVARIAGSPGVALGAWALGGGIALLGALTFAGLGRRYHGNGAQYEALRDAWGAPPAFLFVFCNATAIQAGAIAIIAIICVEHAGDAIAGAAPSGWALILLSMALVGLLVTANVIGVRFGSGIQNLTVVAKVLTLVAIGAAAALLADGAPTSSPVAPEPEGASADRALILVLFAAVVPAFFAYGGWQHALWIAGEVREPRRTLPIAIIGGVIGVGAVYLLANWAYFRLLGQDGVAGSQTLAADAVRTVWNGGSRVVGGAVAISAFGVLNAQLLSGPRLVQGMARDGRFFAPFARVHKRFGTPAWAVVLLGGLAWTLLLAAGFSRSGVDLLLTGVVFVDGIFFALTGAAAVILMRRNGNDGDGVRIIGGWPTGAAIAALFVIGEAGIVTGALLADDWWGPAIGAGWIALAAVVYFTWFAQRASKPTP